MRICSVNGCDQKHRRNGYCNTHSFRQRRTGTTDAPKMGRRLTYFTAEERKAVLKRRQRIYDQSPKGKIASVLKRHRRRARGGDVTLTSEQALQILEKFNHQCFNCQTKIDLTLDHHIPLVSGGKLELGNCAILCRKCNGIKSDRHPLEFYSPEQLSVLESLL